MAKKEARLPRRPGGRAWMRSEGLDAIGCIPDPPRFLISEQPFLFQKFLFNSCLEIKKRGGSGTSPPLLFSHMAKKEARQDLPYFFRHGRKKRPDPEGGLGGEVMAWRRLVVSQIRPLFDF